MSLRRAHAAIAALLTLPVLTLACGGDDGGVTPPPPETQQGTIAGTALDDGGQPVSGVGVALVQGGSTLRSATTGADGAFQFADVDVGAYTLSLTAPPGFQLAAGQANPVGVTVTANSTTNVTLQFEADLPLMGGVEGSARFQGEGVQGATVDLGGAGTGQTVTDADGDYRFEDLDPGDYTVTLTPPAPFVLAAGETATKNVTVTAGPNADADFQLALPGASPVVQIQLTSNPFSFVGPSGGSTETVARGTTVRWVNTDATFHTVTPDGHDRWDRTETQAPGAVLDVLFVNPGTFDYFCEPHRSLGMTGTIIVQ